MWKNKILLTHPAEFGEWTQWLLSLVVVRVVTNAQHIMLVYNQLQVVGCFSAFFCKCWLKFRIGCSYQIKIRSFSTWYVQHTYSWRSLLFNQSFIHMYNACTYVWIRRLCKPEIRNALVTASWCFIFRFLRHKLKHFSLSF
jgi:hypothetical protein